MHKREGRERRRAHGVRDAVSEGPIPLPGRTPDSPLYPYGIRIFFIVWQMSRVPSVAWNRITAKYTPGATVCP